MASALWTTRRISWLAVGLLLLTARAGRAQEIDVRNVLDRLERVEKQNEQLRKKVQAQEEELQRRRESPPANRQAGNGGGPGPASDDAEGTPVNPAVGQATGIESGAPIGKIFEVGKDFTFDVTWRDGLFLETKDQAYRLHFGGEMQIDGAWYRSSRAISNSIGQFNNYVDPELGLSDGADLRRARLRAEGTIHDTMSWRVEYDFVNAIDLRQKTLGVTNSSSGSSSSSSSSSSTTIYDFDPVNGTRFTDIWMAFNSLPYIGTIKVGHQKEPLDFTTSTGDRFLPFMERPMIFDAFNQDFQFILGIAAERTYLDGHAYSKIGIMRNNNNAQDNSNLIGGFDTGDGDYAYDARVTCMPIDLCDGNVWMHLGFDYSYRNPSRNMTRYRALLEERGGNGFESPTILNTGTIFTLDAEQIFNFEFASSYGPLAVTAEYARSEVGHAYTGGLPLADGTLPSGAVAHGNYVAQGYYVEALYFLTDDHRMYRKDLPGYDRVRPREEFFLLMDENGKVLSGRGAWEVGLRYDYLDLSNAGINGGFAYAVTAGVNWFLNPNMKVQFNYTWMRRNFEPTDTAGRLAGDINSFGTRFHYDF